MSDAAPLITLRPLDTNNARPVVRLKVASGQERFVRSNADSIADAYVERWFIPLAVYAGDELVGFSMYGQDPETDHWWIVRVMIDERYQRRGYGRAAMMSLIDLMGERHGARNIRLGVDPANQRAIALYASLGFRDTGVVDYDEMVMCLGLDSLTK